jgi:predicted Zn-dependent protease with MMP-like domain
MTNSLTRAEFEALVVQALNDIPEEIGRHLNNVDVVVEDVPNRDKLAGNELGEGELLLGLYEGVPLTERYGYGEVLPDKISLFQGSIEALGLSSEDMVREIADTVVHEVAHHFGIDDERLHELGY